MAPPRFAWPNGAQAAVSLTYDGAYDSHLDEALTEMNSVGFRGTFYADVARLLERLPRWRHAAASGHEIANGCLFEAADADGVLGRWTPTMVAAELAEARSFLDEHFHVDHSFAFPWGSPQCGDGADYRAVVSASGYAARAGVEGFNKPESCDLGYFRCIPCSSMSAEELCSLAEIGVRGGAWVVFAFPCLNSPSMRPRAHRELVRWLWTCREDLWVAPVSKVAPLVAERRLARVG